MVKDKWKVVRKNVNPSSIAGLYKAFTSAGRNIYGYGRNVEEAIRNISPGLKWDEQIKSISRSEYIDKLYE